VWLSTVWGLDWPAGTTPVAQRQQLINILNHLEESNFNTIYFQVRTMSDAFYKSRFVEEPWSHWLFRRNDGTFNISNRGQDPGWDPLEFIIDEAHKRGMELHAWLNPYRYSSGTTTHGNLSTDYARTHPHWLLDYSGVPTGESGNPPPVHPQNAKILNPGIPEVKERIADIVEDIIRNYNVDGIVFDDYFYMTGTTDAMDNAQFLAHNPNGLNRADWRRENVNEMIRLVQERINGISPWIQFGLSPAGIAVGANEIVAAIYGVPTLPGTHDWQRNDISSSPLAWLRDGTIDYISPQIYWDTSNGGAANPPFGAVSDWWARVSNQFGRHFFSSNTNRRGGRNNGELFRNDEILHQVQLLRNADRNGTAGQVHFRYDMYLRDSRGIYNDLKENPYRYLALTAVYGWKPAPMQTLVTDLNISGQNVTWNYTPNGNFDVRFAIYAVPIANCNDADAFTSPRHLKGISYSREFTLPAGITTTSHRIAVAVFDRFGNLFPVRVFGESQTTIAPAQLTLPANNATDVTIPSMFTWEANGADFYVWQIAEDAAFTRPIASRETTSPNFNLGLQGNIKPNTTYYWRVKSIKANAPVSVSEVRVFNGTQFQILTPANGTADVSRTPEITWANVGDGVSYTLEVSMQANFSSILYTATVQTNTATIPTGVLRIATTYHVRVRADLGAIQVVSPQIRFATEDAVVSAPVIISPADGEIIRGNEVTVSWQEQLSRTFRVELSESATFPTRNTRRIDTDFNEFTATFDNVVEDTYFLRVIPESGAGLLARSASDTIRIRVQIEASVPEKTIPEFFRIYHISDGIFNLVINQAESNSVIVEFFSITGNLIDRQTHRLNAGANTITLDMTNYAKGIYLVRVNAGNNTKTLRVHR